MVIAHRAVEMPALHAVVGAMAEAATATGRRTRPRPRPTLRRAVAIAAMAGAGAGAGAGPAAQGRAGRELVRACHTRLPRFSHSRQSAKPLRGAQRSNLTFVTYSYAMRGMTGKGQP